MDNDKKESRRVRMTKRLIQNALLELLEERPLGKITVTDICRVADVNRSTFYANYVDVRQLLTEIEEDIIGQIPVSSDFPKINMDMRFLDMLESFFQYVKDHGRLFKILIVEENNSDFNNRLVDAAMQRYHIKTHANEPLISRYKYIYRINGVIGLIKEWIDADFPIDARTFARFVLKMTTTEEKEIWK